MTSSTEDAEAIADLIDEIEDTDVPSMMIVMEAIEDHPAWQHLQMEAEATKRLSRPANPDQRELDRQAHQRDMNTSSTIDSVLFGAILSDPLADYKIGDLVEFGPTASPKYLIGRRGMKITKVNPKSVKVDVPDEPGFGRFAGKGNVGCPKTIIRKSTIN